MDDPASHKASGRRLKYISVARNSGTLQEVHRCLETHLLKWRAVTLNAESVERLVAPLEGHVVTYQRQVPVVDGDPVDFEHSRYFL